MSEYSISEDRDVTRFYLKKVLEGKAPAIGRLSADFEAINIDRVLQSFIDSVLISPKNADEAMQLVGEINMAMKIKKFFCNLNNISIAVESGDLEVDSLLDVDSISESDLEMAKNLQGSK